MKSIVLGAVFIPRQQIREISMLYSDSEKNKLISLAN